MQTDYIPQIAYGSSESYTGKDSKFKRYLSTIPPDENQILAIIQLIEYFDWTFPFVIAADDDFGRNSLLLLQTKLDDSKICLAASHLFDVQNPNIQNIIADLKIEHTRTTVVVLLCEYEHAKTIIEAVNREGLLNLTWVGTESWATNTAISRTNIPTLNNGIISIKKTIPKVREFEDFFDNIKVKSHLPNVWFESYWKSLGIDLDGEPKGDLIKKPNYYNVMSAVYATAHGLHKYLNCTETRCENNNKPILYAKLISDIVSSSFTVPGTVQKFQFNKYGDVVSTSYEFVAWPRSISETEKSLYYIFGNWSADNQSTTYVNFSLLKQTSFKSTPIAKCSQPCKPGYTTIIGERKCCWECAKCDKDFISVDGINCFSCPFKTISDLTHTTCQNLTNINFSLKNLGGQVIFGMSFLGAAVGLASLFLFIKNWNTPIIRASSREMSTTQLISIVLLFCLPLLYLNNLTKILCGVQIIWFGILYAYIISFILIKTYRLLRVFRKKRFSKISRFLKNKYQIMLSLSLVTVQLIGEICWFFVYPPKIESYINNEMVTIVDYCGNNTDILLYYNIAYVFFLSLVSGWMAFRARKLPENFNEAQYITFAMFTTCLSWALFGFLHATSEREEKNLIFLIINLINNFCLLTILYGHRFIIIIFYPHLNNKSYFQKMRKNATVTAYINQNELINKEKLNGTSMVKFDFDTMFDSYRRKNKTTASFKETSTIMKQSSTTLQNSKILFKENDGKQNSKIKRMKKFTKSMQQPNDKLKPSIKRSASLNHIKTFQNQAFDNYSDIENKAEIFKRKKEIEATNSIGSLTSQTQLVRRNSEQ